MQASKPINVLGRLAHLLNTESRMCIFRPFILCHFSYCSLVWHFCGIGMQNTKKLEKLQERGLTFVFQNFSTVGDNLLMRLNTSVIYTEIIVGDTVSDFGLPWDLLAEIDFLV